MGLREDLQQLATYVMNTTMGSAAEVITYKSRGAVAYNAAGAAGSQITESFTSVTGIRAAIGQLQEIELETAQTRIVTKERNCVIAALDLGDVEPKSQDVIIMADSSVWIVETVNSDPSLATYLMRIRAEG